MTDPISLAPLPAPLTWDVRPASWNVEDGPELIIAAPPRSDLFVDPAGAEPQAGAPRLLGPVEGDFQLSARVRCTFAGAFDAGAPDVAASSSASISARARSIGRPAPSACTSRGET